jgi:hypothetical protein
VRHPGQVLNFAGQLRIPGEDIVHCLTMRRAHVVPRIRGMVTRTVVHAGAATHSAAHAPGMTVLGQCWCTADYESQGDYKNVNVLHCFCSSFADEISLRLRSTARAFHTTASN